MPRMGGLRAAVLLFSSLAATSTRPARAAEDPWASLLRRDLEFVHRTLLENHPGAVDTLNQDFSRWLEAGYRQALARARTCVSYEGYRFALEAYVVGFRDVHLDLWTELRREEGSRWPGFLVGWQAETGKLVVRVVGEGKAGEGAPPIGSEVVSCDGKPARELVEREVFPFWGNPAFERGWEIAVPQWLIDERNPWREHVPRTCTIIEKGVTREHVLGWRDSPSAELRAYRAAARPRAKVDFAIRPFGERGIWVSMPSFNAHSAAIEAPLKKAIQQAPSWRDRDPIVFDVRTSDGGSSAWGRRLLEALYGKELVASQYEPLRAKEYVEWRLSPGNVEHVKNVIVAGTIRVNGAGSPAEAGARAAGLAMARALAEGKTLWRDEKVKERPLPAEARTPANPVPGRVFLLTDAGCASACLDFADMVRVLPGAQHVGRTTAGDSVYMEARVLSLPSGVATMVIPTKVYRNRPRGNNEPYVPHHVWKGDIGDTPALERWILSLPRASR